MNQLTAYTLRLGDNCLVLSQRLGEWCGHAPELEIDLALANIGLDLLGQARNFLSYAAELAGEGDEDTLAFTRDERQFSNLLLVEQPNGNFADTIARQYFIDAWHVALFTRLMESRDTAQQLARHLATQPTFGLGLIKQAINSAETNTLDTQLDLERDYQRLAGRSADYREGVSAFLAKRSPQFTGK